MGCYRARGGARAWRRRHKNHRAPLGPGWSSTFPRIRSRGACLDQRDHRHGDALRTNPSSYQFRR
eukprot:9476885-Pyramimonas_sp.AAC.1